jgi:aarF domain-containing kinase
MQGKNAIQFSKNMKSLPNVKVPGVYLEYTCRKVLTCEWVNGEKLSESNAADLLPLVTTALNCYLVQLLETGFLHADPHPGNLLRTPDGHLCVLDFGLMTEVTEDQRYTLVEYISHVVNSDYPRVAEDLVRLGFVPPELADPRKTAAVAPQLGRIMGQLIQGGGARKINVQQLTEDLVNISKDYVFVIPPYFALILRAFSVLEGIGLDADPDYSIVDECYPYLSKRLLTDDRCSSTPHCRIHSSCHDL